MEPKKQELVVTPKTIIDDVLVKIENFRETGELTLPADYSPENALKSAYLILSETVDKDKNPVLKSCTPISIANSLLDMVVQGLSPMKNQCYFIAYGPKLQMSRSYLGSIAMAKRCGLHNIVANVIYQDDEFAYNIDANTGRLNILSHKQKLENIDISKIRGAYALTTMDDGTKDTVVMTIAQIKQSWLQGYAKGNSGAHTNFTDEMSKKTVISRACKMIINSSTDVMLTSTSIENEDEDTKNAPIGANVNEIEVVAETVKEPAKTKQKVKKNPAPQQPEF